MLCYSLRNSYTLGVILGMFRLKLVSSEKNSGFKGFNMEQDPFLYCLEMEPVGRGEFAMLVTSGTEIEIRCVNVLHSIMVQPLTSIDSRLPKSGVPKLTYTLGMGVPKFLLLRTQLGTNIKWELP